MTFSFALLAPNAAANTTMVAGRSGNSYTSDVYGVLKLVTPQDAFDLMQGGALSLGQIQARNNLSAVTAPGVTNDLSQDYGVGSRWLNTANNTEYVCFSAASGNATWAVL